MSILQIGLHFIFILLLAAAIVLPKLQRNRARQ